MCSFSFLLPAFFLFPLLTSSRPSSVGSDAPPSSSSSPNILFLMMDDLGYSDISARGGEFATPHLDALYSTSIILNSYYVGISVCSPSRTQILTGRYAWNLGLSELSNFGPGWLASMPAGVPTLGNLLREHSNYRTYAAGKWHVGYVTKWHGPMRRGFDDFQGFLTSGIGYTDKKVNGYLDWWRGERIDYKSMDTFSTDATGDFIINAIETHMREKRNKNSKINEYNKKMGENDDDAKPFYVYGTFQPPHEVLEYVESENVEDCEFLLMTEDDPGEQRYLYCVNMKKLDEVIGNIVEKLKEDETVWQNTLVVVTSDNGGALFKGACNHPLTGNKADFFEGGVRTMAFVSGGFVPSAQYGSERNGLMHGVDWVPTLASLSGLDVKTLASSLQRGAYAVASKQASLRRHGSEAHANKYLIDQALDGLDLSEWLLQGDENLNPRTSVALSINSFDAGRFRALRRGSEAANEANEANVAIEEIEDDSDESGALEDVSDVSDGSEDVSERLDESVDSAGKVAIVFKSDITGHVYKLIYLDSDGADTARCTIVQSGDLLVRDVQMISFDSNKLLFDLTLDSREEKNLYDYLSASESSMDNLDTSDADEDELFEAQEGLKLHKQQKLQKQQKRRLMQLNGGDGGDSNSLSMADYAGAEGKDLVSRLWAEGEAVIDGYSRGNVMFNDYLRCLETSLGEVADPSKQDPESYAPFLSWDEYRQQWEDICGDEANSLLFELYTTRYDELREQGMELLKMQTGDENIGQYGMKSVAEKDIEMIEKIKELQEREQKNEKNEQNDESTENKNEKNEKKKSKKEEEERVAGWNGKKWVLGMGVALLVIVGAYGLIYPLVCGRKGKYSGYMPVGP